MATLTELIADLEANASVISVVEIEDHTTYLFYTLTYIEDVALNVGNQETLCVLVHDRGEPTETAYFKGKLPAPLRYEANFRETVISRIETYQSTHPELEYYIITRCDSEARIALVTAYEYDDVADTTAQNQYIILADPWRFRRVV